MSKMGNKKLAFFSIGLASPPRGLQSTATRLKEGWSRARRPKPVLAFSIKSSSEQEGSARGPTSP